MKKILSIFLSFILMISCASFAQAAFGASHKHEIETVIYPAKMETPDKWKDGSIVKTCKTCHQEIESTKIIAPKKLKVEKSSYVYDGKTKIPKITVYNREEKVISSDNYEITGEKNKKKVGIYALSVIFNNKYYQGDMLCVYKILPKGTSISSLKAKKKGFTVKWNKQATQTTGYEIHYATDSAFSKNSAPKIITDNKKTSVTVSNLKSKKKYYVKIRTYKTVEGVKIYSSWSKAKTVKTK